MPLPGRARFWRDMARISQLGAPARHLAKTFDKFGSKPITRFKPALKNLHHDAGQVRDNPSISAQRRRAKGRAQQCGF
jgi:hypothetical protein